MKRNILYFACLCVSLLLFLTFPGIRDIMGDGNYPPLKQSVRYIYLALILLSFILFGVFLSDEAKKGACINMRQKMLAASAIGIIFLFTAPVFSIDLHCYIMQGRVLSVHGQNPYVVPPGAFPEDPFTKGIFWLHRPVFYGPLWVLFSVFLSFFGGDSVLLNVVLMKVPVFLAYLLLIWQGFSLARKIIPRQKDIIASFLAFNPFIVSQYLLDGHNDILMAALAVTGFNLLIGGRMLRGCFFYGLSVFTKFMTGLIFPVFVWVGFLVNKNARKNVVFTVSLTVMMVLSGIALFSPFIGDAGFFDNLKGHKLAGSGGLDSNTIPYLMLLAGKMSGLCGGVDMFHPPFVFTVFCHILFIASVFGITLFMAVHGRDFGKVFSSASLIFISYFVFEAFSFGAWFLIWLIPFVLFSDIKRKYLLVFLISLAGALSFWKRLSFLLAGAASVYLVFNMFDLRRSGTGD